MSVLVQTHEFRQEWNLDNTTSCWKWLNSPLGWNGIELIDSQIQRFQENGQKTIFNYLWVLL